MSTPDSIALPRGGQVGALLRHWRDLRRKSQLELSLDTGVSQRHLSFIEIGRSAPSRQMLIDIATALDIPLRDRNTLLLAGGYAPIYQDGAWDGPEMRAIAKALEQMLRRHEPFPALVMDRYWNVLMTNRSAPRFFGRFTDLSARKPPRNMLHLVFDPAGLRPCIADWPAVARSLMQRVYREAVGRVIDDKTRELLAALMAYPGVEPDWLSPKAADARAAMPVIPLGLVKDGRVLNYFSLVTTVGTPQTVAAQEIRIECMFPADEATEALHAELLGEEA
ncbi:transcriptional regulator [Bordetella genomosp. 10]|uniref:Transcriptional regulator n=1 Tax=Bordetella genomosp. 10 TaxID=1416804 RepID=A0A261S9H7_9BORD|nr:helix-turn-helix transcriptional regulator [Bordetella genomosp. 10]OZI33996.1 transcriptional regulator [Bordetella genomosp. 10]